MASPRLDDSFSPDLVMDPRNLGALQPTRLSASRSFLAKMVREGWRIDRDLLELDRRGNGRARYTITTPNGPLTFVAWLREPVGKNRTGRIIGTAWDMIGSLIDGIASDDQVEITEREMPKLYEGRAPGGTLIWMRSNQSLRIFRHVRESLASGVQPDVAAIKRVGYLMRNTGLDGNGTFGAVSFPAIPAGHPLKVSYHAQMLSAYLMRELAVDVVEELARLDAPERAVRLSAEVKRFIGVGNGSALGLVMFVYNRPVLIDAYISAYLDAVKHVLTQPIPAGDSRLDALEALLNRTIRYRALEETQYRVFTGSNELAVDLRRIRARVRAARRGDVVTAEGETLLAAVHRSINGRVSLEAIHSFNALLLELIPEYCDELVATRLDFDETLDLDPATPLSIVREAIEENFLWAIKLPLNDPEFRDRAWYQSRAAEEPRSGPQEEVPHAHEVIPNYPDLVRELFDALTEHSDDAPIGALVAARPELEHVTRVVLSMRGRPYGVPHADPHDIDFVPVWIIRLMNAFVHGLDRTEDYLNRSVLGLIYEGAPFRDELATADPSSWWWSYQAMPEREPVASPAAVSSIATSVVDVVPAAKLTPRQSAIVAPRHGDDERIVMKFREARLAAGRAMQALNVPEGSWHGARDFFVTSVLPGPEGVAGFGGTLARLLDSDGNAPVWRPPTSFEEGSGLVVDGHGQSLMVLGHVLINLIGSAATPTGRTVVLRGVVQDGALPGLVLGLARYGIEVEQTVEQTVDSDAALALVATIAQDQTESRARYQEALRGFVFNGLEVPAQQWWDVYYPGNAGLYPDTPISRQHTGTVTDVYVPGQKLTKLFAQEELNAFADPNRDTDHVLPAATA